MASKTIGSFVTLQRGITYKGNLVGAEGPALLGLGSIVPGGGFRESDYKTYGGDCPEKITLKPGDIFASLKGATKDGKMIGSVARVPNSIAKGRLTQDTVKLEFLERNTSFENYIYWLLRTPQYRDYCAKRATGSAVVALSRDDFLSYPVPEHTEVRARIITLLELIDNKITLNRQINQTLEQMAQTLFKSWFVDFDPVIDNALDAGNAIPDELQARAEQRQALRHAVDEANKANQPHSTRTNPAASDALASPYQPLPDDLRQLFPNEFEESELGWVPKGWRVKSLDQIANYQNGLALQKFRPATETEEYLPVLKIAQLRQGYCDDKEKASIDIKESCRVYDGDMIFSWSGTLMIDIWTGGKAALNQHLYKVTSKEYPQSFYLHWTKHHLARFQHIAAAKAVTMGHIKKGDLSDSKCLIPPDELISNFDRLAGKYIDKIKSIRLQSNTLETLRDTLLPKLISGELRLDEVESTIAETTA